MQTGNDDRPEGGQEPFDGAKTTLTRVDPQKAGRLRDPSGALSSDSTRVGRSGKPRSRGGLPTLYVVTEGDPVRYPIRSSVRLLSVGRSAEASTVALDDQYISARQLVILRLAGEWVFCDCGDEDVVRFNGVLSRQFVGPAGCQAVIQLGTHFLVFTDPAVSVEAPAGGPLPLSAGQVADSQTAAAGLVLRHGRATAMSTRRPLLLGSHVACDLRCRDAGVAPFHAFVFWHRKGVSVQPLGAPYVGIGSRRAETAESIFPGTTISLGSHSVAVQLNGDWQRRSRELFPPHEPEFDRFCLTPLGREAGEPVGLPSPDKLLTIGRDPGCDIVIEDTSVSRQHAQVVPRSKCVSLVDADSANGTFVNGDRVQRTRLRAGDIVEFGNRYFLLHYRRRHSS